MSSQEPPEIDSDTGDKNLDQDDISTLDESDETDQLEPTEDTVRIEIVQKVIDALLADAQRGDGELARADIDRQYSRRNLTISECAKVEQELLNNSLKIIEDDDSEIELMAVPEAVSIFNLGNKRFLNESEERELGRKIQLAIKLEAEGTSGNNSFDLKIRDESAKAKKVLVETNLRYVWKVAKEYKSIIHLNIDDVFQEGMLGLLKATEKYDPELGFRFKTYATWWIRQNIHRSIADKDRLVRLPVHIQDTLNRVRKFERLNTPPLGSGPSINSIADHLGMEPEKLVKMMWIIEATNCVAGDMIIGGEDNATTILDVQKDTSTLSAFDAISARQLKARFSDVFSTLTARQERVIRKRFGFSSGGEQTLEEIGNEFGLTRERIRQIEAKALRKLKHPTRRRKLKDFLD